MFVLVTSLCLAFSGADIEFDCNNKILLHFLYATVRYPIQYFVLMASAAVQQSVLER